MASGACPRRALGWRAGVLVAAVISVAGCVGMPDSGAPGQATAVQASTLPDLNSGLFPAAPKAGEAPWDIVLGFLTASASYPSDAIALDYLTSAASRKWEPGWSVTVFNRFDVTQSADVRPTGSAARHGDKWATVDVTGPVQAAFNATGQYVSAKDQVQKVGAYPFQLVQVNGQWRITNPPSYRIIPAWEFPLVYKAEDLYYFDPTYNVLVPDSVFVPLGTSPEELVKSLVTALTRDPQTPWLQGAAHTVFPPGTKVLGVTLDGAAATVNLGGTAIAKAGTSTLEQVSAQLVWTLAGSQASPSSTQSVELEIDGKPFTSASSCGVSQGLSAFQKQASYECYNPYPSAPVSFVYAAGGQAWLRCGAQTQAQQGDIGPVVPMVSRSDLLNGPQCPTAGFVPTNSLAPPPVQRQSLPEISSVAVSPDQKYVAFVSPDRDALYVGAISGHAVLFPQTPRWAAPNITALSWDRNDDLWVVQNGVIYMVPATGKPASVTGSPGTVTDLSVAPDGVRIAIIVQDGDGSEVELAAVKPNGASQPGPMGSLSAHPSIGDAVPLGPNITHPMSLAWYDADDLLVLDGSGNQDTLWEVPADGQQASGPQLAPTGAVSITADGPANALVAGLSDGKLAVSTGLDVQWQYLSQPGSDPAYP